jgi:hypothetical protein
MRSLLSSVIAVGLVGSAILAGCGGSGTSLGAGNLPNNTVGGTTNNTGAVQYRVLDGAPDVPAIDVYIDGTRTVTGMKYGTFGGAATAPYYANLQPSNHNVTVCISPSAPPCPTALANTTATILASSFRTTIVITEKTQATATTPVVLNSPALAFNEPYLSSTLTSATLVWHHAASLSAGGILAYGTFIPPPPSQPLGNPIVHQYGILNFSAPPLAASMAVQRNFVIAQGTELYVAPDSSPTAPPSTAPLYLNDLIRVFPTPLPSQGPLDPNGTLPCTDATGALCVYPYQNFSVYAVDVVPTPSASPQTGLIGVFDPNN